MRARKDMGTKGKRKGGRRGLMFFWLLLISTNVGKAMRRQERINILKQQKGPDKIPPTSLYIFLSEFSRLKI